VILVVPNPLLGERAIPPMAFVSKDDLRTIERVEAGKLD
jgi:hypothetical protein